MDRHREILGKHFKDAGNYDVEDFVYAHGDPKQALLLFHVFWPQFVAVDGHIVLKTAVDKEDGPSKLEALLKEGAKPRQEILSAYRWLEVPYLFQDRSSLSDDDDRYLAEIIVETWKGALCAQFPDKQFSVSLLEPEATGSVVGVCFLEQAGA
jgi:hypothetical protein